jgi:2OG-Fe(II) oxygenase superfamily
LSYAIPSGIALLSATGLVALVASHRTRRHRLLEGLLAGSEELRQRQSITLAAQDPTPARAAFAQSRMSRVPNFLTENCLQQLCEEGRANLPRLVRSFVPGHKQGGAVCYEKIIRHLPGCLAFYHSPEVQKWIESITGVPVKPTPVDDQSSLSLLCYTEAGDHIAWHYDHNFYRGRHFTVLLPLVNRSASGGLSSSLLMRQTPEGDEICDTSANSLVVFEGAQVRHKATPTSEGDLRIMLSMTYCVDPRISMTKEFLRRCKDTAFFGLRTLWD